MAINHAAMELSSAQYECSHTKFWQVHSDDIYLVDIIYWPVNLPDRGEKKAEVAAGWKKLADRRPHWHLPIHDLRTLT